MFMSIFKSYSQIRSWYLLLILLMTSCGQEANKNTKFNPKTPDVNIHESSFTEENKPEMTKTKFSLIEPKELGGPWKRVIKFLDSPPVDTIVEKLNTNGEWVVVALVDENREAVDSQIEFPTQYRLGRKLLTEKAEAVSDLFISGKMKKNIRVSAHRVIVERDIELSDLTLSVHAEIFYLVGNIYSYSPKDYGSSPGGLLSVQAEIVTGPGSIYLNGQNGQPSRPGSNGKAGHNQSCAYPNRKYTLGENGKDATLAGNGGDGGEVFIYSNKVEIEKIVVSPGLGGVGSSGGRGGQGGKIRSCKYELIRDICAKWKGAEREQKLNAICPYSKKRAVSGKNGKSQSSAKAGKPGKYLNYQI